MAAARPALGVGGREPARLPPPHLAAGPRDEIVDAVPVRVLEVVFMTAEAGADATRLEQLDHARHPIGVAMQRSGAERRMMAERNPPADAIRCRRRKGPLHEIPVLRVFEDPPAPEEVLLRRIEADEL